MEQTPEKIVKGISRRGFLGAAAVGVASPRSLLPAPDSLAPQVTSQVIESGLNPAFLKAVSEWFEILESPNNTFKIISQFPHLFLSPPNNKINISNIRNILRGEVRSALHGIANCGASTQDIAKAIHELGNVKGTKEAIGQQKVEEVAQRIWDMSHQAESGIEATLDAVLKPWDKQITLLMQDTNFPTFGTAYRAGESPVPADYYKGQPANSWHERLTAQADIAPTKTR